MTSDLLHYYLVVITHILPRVKTDQISMRVKNDILIDTVYIIYWLIIIQIVTKQLQLSLITHNAYINNYSIIQIAFPHEEFDHGYN